MAPSASSRYAHGVRPLDFLVRLIALLSLLLGVGAVIRWGLQDAHRRGRPGWAVALLLVAAPVVGWLVWLALRPGLVDQWRRDPPLPTESRASHFVLAACLALAWYNVGTAWTTQRVLFPLRAFVGQGDYFGYEARYAELTQLPVVTVFSLLLLATALLLWVRPSDLPEWSVWLGGLLEAITVFWTLSLQLPLQARIGQEGFSETLHQQVIANNWVRTAAITAHAVLLVWMTVRIMTPRGLLRGSSRWGV
jgi:hypothetical protein